MAWRAFSMSGKADFVVMEGEKKLLDISMCWEKSLFPTYESSRHK